MQSIVAVAIPVVVFFVMTIVGLDLTLADFRQVTRRPGLVLGLTLAQAALPPLLLLGILVYQTVGVFKPRAASTGFGQ